MFNCFLKQKFGKEEMEAGLMCADKDVTGAALREIVNHGKKFRLEKFEIPGALTLIDELWLPGMATNTKFPPVIFPYGAVYILRSHERGNFRPPPPSFVYKVK